MSTNKPRRRTEDRPAWTPPVQQAAKPVTATRTVEAPDKPQQASTAKQEYLDVVIEEIPPYCPACKSTDREYKNGTITRTFSGTCADGRPYNRVKWTHCKCKNCGQAYRVIARINTSSK